MSHFQMMILHFAALTRCCCPKRKKGKPKAARKKCERCTSIASAKAELKKAGTPWVPRVESAIPTKYLKTPFGG